MTNDKCRINGTACSIGTVGQRRSPDDDDDRVCKTRLYNSNVKPQQRGTLTTQRIQRQHTITHQLQMITEQQIDGSIKDLADCIHTNRKKLYHLLLNEKYVVE